MKESPTSFKVGHDGVGFKTLGVGGVWGGNLHKNTPHLLLLYRLHMKVRVHSQIWSSTSGPGPGVDDRRDPTYNVTRVKRSPAGFIRLYQSTHPKLNSLF